MISTSSSSPILNEEDEKEDRDEEQPSILTSPSSSSSSVASNSKRRRNKKKKGGETIASRLVDVSSMSLLNESIEVKTAISSFSSLIAQEQIVKESGEATTMMMMKKKEEDELMKKRGDEVTRETVTSLALTNTSPIISQARYKGPVVPWASIAPDVDPSSFNAWGKFVFASMRGAGAAGEHFKTQI